MKNPKPLESTFRSRAVPFQGRVACRFLMLVYKFYLVTVEKLLPNLTKEKYYIVSNIFQWCHTWDLRVTMLGLFAPSSLHIVYFTRVVAAAGNHHTHLLFLSRLLRLGMTTVLLGASVMQYRGDLENSRHQFVCPWSLEKCNLVPLI